MQLDDDDHWRPHNQHTLAIWDTINANRPQIFKSIDWGNSSLQKWDYFWLGMSHDGFYCTLQPDLYIELNRLPTNQERFCWGALLSATTLAVGMVEILVKDPSNKGNALLFNPKYVHDSIPIGLHCEWSCIRRRRFQLRSSILRIRWEVKSWGGGRNYSRG